MWLAYFRDDVGYAQVANGGVLKLFQRKRLRHRHPAKTHGIARLELPHLPQFGLNNDDRAYKSAQAGAVRSQYYRHVAGEIHTADGIGIVVDVGWMQPRLTAIAARPLRFGTDQAHAAAAGVVMHLPVRREEGFEYPRR